MVELVVVDLEVDGLGGEDYLMKVEVVEEGCLMDDPTHFSAYHLLGFDHQA